MDACIIEVDRTSTYLKRIFCIFEVFAAVLHRVKLRCAPKVVLEEAREDKRWKKLMVLAREVQKMDCAKAESRDPASTADIKRHIERTVGFAGLNDAVKTAMLLGMDSARPGQGGIRNVGDGGGAEGGEPVPWLCFASARARVRVCVCVCVCVCVEGSQPSRRSVVLCARPACFSVC